MSIFSVSKKRVLVTGGAGFLGFHLCKKLLEKGYEVLAIDNFFSGFRDNIIELQKFPSFEFVRMDVKSKMNFKLDLIFNLACPASPVHYQKDPVETLTTCIQGAINVLNLANDNNATVFQASTSEVYGDPKVHPQTENYWGNVNPIGHRACYDEGKRCAETLFFDYHRQFNTKIKVARIFNTYGPRMSLDDGRVISNFISQAIKGEKISIYGNGEQTRSFCYVDDLVDGIIDLTLSKLPLVGPVNLGNPEEIKIIDIANKIIELTKSTSKISFHSLPMDDPVQRNPDISLAKDKLSWKPKITLDSGLLKTIDFFKSVIDKKR